MNSKLLPAFIIAVAIIVLAGVILAIRAGNSSYAPAPGAVGEPPAGTAEDYAATNPSPMAEAAHLAPSGSEGQTAVPVEPTPTPVPAPPAPTPAPSAKAASASAHPAPPMPPAPPAPPGPSAQVPEAPAPSAGAPGRTVPAGTMLTATLDGELSSKTASVGQAVDATLTQPVYQAGEITLPAGTRLHGRVAEVREAGRVKGNGHVKIAFTELELATGQRTAMHAEWEATAEPPRKRDVGIIAGSAAGGAVLGKVLGKDNKDAVRGAVIGGAIGTGVVLANKGSEVELPAGQALMLQLSSAVVLPGMP